MGFTTVVPLDAVDTSVDALCADVWLNVRAGEGGALWFGLGGGSICPALRAAAFSLLALRVNLAAVPRLACSINPCTLAEMADDAVVAAVLRGEDGFSGERAVVGRAIMLFAGEAG